MNNTTSIRDTILERVAGAVAYLPLVGRLILLLLPTRGSRQLRFHLFQSSLFGFVSMVTGAGLVSWRKVYPIEVVLKMFVVGDVALIMGLSLTALLARPIILPGLGTLAHRLADVEPGWLQRALRMSGK